MGEISARNFGLLIAYLIPGFVALWGVGQHVDVVRLWLEGAQGNGPTVGGFLYLTLASVGAGMTASLARWALLDTLHRRTGLVRPDWDDSRLQDRLEAFDALVENHYRYYQFYGNSAVAIFVAYLGWKTSPASVWGWWDFLFVCTESLFIAGSRDTLRNYYRRASTLLGTIERLVHHDQRTRNGRLDAGQEHGLQDQAARQDNAGQDTDSGNRPPRRRSKSGR